MTPSPARPISAAEKPAPLASVLPCLLIAAGIFLSGCASTEGELAAVREASRIAEEARRDQADQTRSFAELEATLSQERQNIDRERAQAAQWHDEAARSRERAIQAHREANEAAARDRFFGQALLACAPLITVAAALLAALRLAQKCYEADPEGDSLIAETLLLEAHIKPVVYDPGLAGRLLGRSRLGLPMGPTGEGENPARASDRDEDPDAGYDRRQDDFPGQDDEDDDPATRPF
jgi:hypothetical protein